jgi:hypothetical protein
LTAVCKLFLIYKTQLFLIIDCTEEKKTIEFSIPFLEKILWQTLRNPLCVQKKFHIISFLDSKQLLSIFFTHVNWKKYFFCIHFFTSIQNRKINQIHAYKVFRKGHIQFGRRRRLPPPRFRFRRPDPTVLEIELRIFFVPRRRFIPPLRRRRCTFLRTPPSIIPRGNVEIPGEKGLIPIPISKHVQQLQSKHTVQAVSGQHLQTVETKSLFLSHFRSLSKQKRARRARGAPRHPSRARGPAAAAAARARFKFFIGKNLAIQKIC